VPAHVLEFLGHHSVMTVATASSTGVPHAATMMYVNDGPTLYFCTRPDTTTAAHVEQNPLISFAIDDYQSDWRAIRGVQGSGQVFVVLSPDAIAAAADLFQAKFPALTDVRARNLSIFRVLPTSLQFIESQQSAGSMQALAQDWNLTMVYNVFRELPSKQAEDVMESLTPIQVGAGDVIVRQGAPADKFFILSEGEVEVVREDDGDERAVATLKSGQFFGEMAVLRDQPRTATVRALTPTSLLAMPADTFRGIVAQSLSTTADFDRLIETRFAELTGDQGPAA
jgi:nitroimidazol reductase NimA-like FMN-containing flavoprotein (pyridoxamine 5'-phosphate oxidase superfamily)